MLWIHLLYTQGFNIWKLLYLLQFIIFNFQENPQSNGINN